MARLLEFAARFGTEQRCIEHLAGLRWPDGFVCSGCGGRQAWRLKARARVYECGTCHRQESVTAGTVFHRTRTDLSKWFLAAYLMGRDKRGVSAKFLQRELAVAYQTAWTMAHKLRHGLSEDPARPLRGFLEADETFIGGRGDPSSRGRSTASPDKSLVVAAVEKVPAPKNRKGKHGHAVPHPVQQHQSLARRHPSRRQRQAPAAVSPGMVLPVQSPQFARWFGRLPDPPRRRMRHHHLRPAHRRHPARWSQPHPELSRASCATCSSRIGRLPIPETNIFIPPKCRAEEIEWNKIMLGKQICPKCMRLLVDMIGTALLRVGGAE